MRRSPLARLTTPAARVLLLVGLTTAVATLRHPTPRSLAAAAVLFGMVALVARPSPARLLRRALVGVAIVAVFTLPVLLSGAFAHASALAGRSILALSIALALAETLPVAELGPSLAALGVPSKLSGLVTTALVQVGLLKETGERIVLARQLRGARGLAVGPDVVAALLVSSAARAEQMALAADLRGYDVRHAAARHRLALSDARVLLPAAGLSVALHALG